MDLVPEKLDEAVILSIANLCVGQESDCRECGDIGGSLHNWLMSTGIRYVIVDLQDEKDICPTFLVELLQLRKRHRIPFLFAGAMQRPLNTLESYDFSRNGMPVFITPEEAIDYVREHYQPLLNIDESQVKYGEAIMSFRTRNAMNKAEGVEDTEAVEADL
jgi:hypothetical protein